MLNLIGHPHAVAGLDLDMEAGQFFLHVSLCGAFHLHLVEQGSVRRNEAEAYIAEAYANVFDADLKSFYPFLVTLHDREHNVLGAVGARSAADQSLYIENYLDQRVECAIAAQSGPVCRDQVVELGNLAIGNTASTYLFLAMIGEWLHQHEMQWIVFSLTAPLRRMLQRSEVPLLELARSERARAPVDGNAWGRYYELDPRVCAVPVNEGLSRFTASYRKLSDHVKIGRARS
jgi:hypothetical protein